jgi:hypothetical protein
MARKREAALPADQASPSDPAAPAGASPEGAEAPRAAADDTEARRSQWLNRFDSWGDHEAGVTVIDDRQNRRMIVKFQDKPSKDVRDVMKGEPYEYKFDDGEQLWYRKYSAAIARQARTEADQLGFTVANIIRGEKGLEQKEAFGIGM